MNRINILLVAGDEHYSQEVKKFLLQSDYYLTIAKNYSSAVKLIQSNYFEVIVCQLVCHNFNGLNFLREIQANHQTAQIPFIFLANKFNHQQHRQAMVNGADDILFLPYNLQDIQDTIASRLKKNQTIIKNYKQEITRLKDSITNCLPHEMRTALTGIVAASELLFRKQHILEPDIVKEMLNCINASGKRLSRLIHNFLLYSELQSTAQDELKVNYLRTSQTLNVKKAIAHIVLQYSQQHSRQADFILELEDACVQIGSANFTKLVTELIDNACKFSPIGTPIKIKSKIKNNQFILEIADCGRGMTSEQIANIGFGVQFNRLVYEQQGFGLGLVISQDLAKLYGGNLWIASTLEKETHVSVALPIAANN